MYTITILEKQTVTTDMITIKTTKPEHFTFVPGQFIQFLIPTPDGKTKPRSYSIASIPTDTYLLFLIKLLPGGIASDYFQSDDYVGKQIEMTEARGRFIVTDDAPSQLYIATGSGMAPIISMLRYELEQKQSKKEMILYFGVRHTTDLFWQKELALLSVDYPNFTYHLTLSKPEKQWDGLRGRVTDHITTDHTIHYAYICGSPPMVMEVRKLLLAHGATTTQIHFEVF